MALNLCRIRFHLRLLTAAFLIALPLLKAHAGIDGLNPLPFDSLSDRTSSLLGATALSIRHDDWKHAETGNFIYHYFNSFIAVPVSVEAEFYYRVIAKELDRDTTQWERKSQIYIFESPSDWAEFQRKAFLDPWTGGIHSNNDLFVIRNPEFKFKGNALGHEVSHLVLHRFFGSGIPLWLNEGFAEYSSRVAYGAFMRARGYSYRPTSPLIPSEDFIPLKVLGEMNGYPSDEKQVMVFYQESEKLVRFLAREDKLKFVQFLDFMSKGNRFDSALWKSYGGRFPNLEMLQSEFKTFAAKESSN